MPRRSWDDLADRSRGPPGYRKAVPVHQCPHCEQRPYTTHKKMRKHVERVHPQGDWYLAPPEAQGEARQRQRKANRLPSEEPDGDAERVEPGLHVQLRVDAPVAKRVRVDEIVAQVSEGAVEEAAQA